VRYPFSGAARSAAVTIRGALTRWHGCYP
jgi:hypothetical protein